MPGTQVADPSVFGLAACDEGGRGFVNASGADGHQCTTSWKSGCKEDAHARISMLVLCKARRWNNQEHGNVKLPEQWRSS